jgi:hypothetical protein
VASTFEYSPELESSKENKPKTDYQEGQERQDTSGEEDSPKNPTHRYNENYADQTVQHKAQYTVCFHGLTSAADNRRSR